MTTDEVELRRPPGLQHLMPWVHVFGIEDDGDRGEAVDAADLDQLGVGPSVEYVRVSALVMAYELARFRLDA